MTETAHKPSAAGAQRFFRPTLAKLKGNLEMLLGASLSMTMSDGEFSDAEAILGGAPTQVVAVRASLEGEETPAIICLLDLKVGLELALLLQMTPESAIMARLGGAIEMAEGERETLGEISNFTVAAFAEQVKELTGGKGKLVQQPLGFASTPEQLKALVPDGEYLISQGSVTVGTFPVGNLVVLLPQGVAEDLIPGLGQEASPDGAAEAPASVAGGDVGDAPFAWVIGAAAGARLGESLASLKLGCVIGSVSELIGALDAGRAPAVVVVGVPSGAEYMIEVAGALRRHPGFGPAPLVAWIAKPTRAVVARCGGAGILTVLPEDADPASVARRLTQTLTGALAARA